MSVYEKIILKKLTQYIEERINQLINGIVTIKFLSERKNN